MSLTAYQYVVLTKQQAQQNASKLVYGTRTSNDDTKVIGKLTTTQTIAGVSMLALPDLLQYIQDNPLLWADPTI